MHSYLQRGLYLKNADCVLFSVLVGANVSPEQSLVEGLQISQMKTHVC